MTSQSLAIQELAQIIRFHRKKSGLTQYDLAKLAGVGKTAIFDLEHGKESLQLNTLLNIMHILNIKLEFSSPLMQTYTKEKQHI